MKRGEYFPAVYVDKVFIVLQIDLPYFHISVGNVLVILSQQTYDKESFDIPFETNKDHYFNQMPLYFMHMLLLVHSCML